MRRTWCLQCCLVCYSHPGLCVGELCLSPCSSPALTFTQSPSCWSQRDSFSREPGSVLPNPITLATCNDYLTLHITCGANMTESPNRDIINSTYHYTISSTTHFPDCEHSFHKQYQSSPDVLKGIDLDGHTHRQTDRFVQFMVEI